ncbi:hypothetical protein LO767_03710 [Halopseudomonas aestusnigri]|uniref:hypothetical protein n=1 Tax=Halopseudomonas aestusnigri TaxID=857252 RepID=UPI001E358076|nr:hypothetical protein [Halopseudomonas aestusnigri]UGV31619.1 hypothetical protein LO767_03710 [Halopseudomonas aestusnigri]
MQKIIMPLLHANPSLNDRNSDRRNRVAAKERDHETNEQPKDLKAKHKIWGSSSPLTCRKPAAHSQ